MATEEELERTLSESQRILDAFEALEQEFRRKREESEELARSLGASSFEQLVQVVTSSLTPAEKELIEKEKAAFQEELEREMREIEERARQEKSASVNPMTARARRFGRTV